MTRWLIRTFLTAMMVVSFLVATWQGWRIATGWPGSAFVDRGKDEIAVVLERALARSVTAPAVTLRLEVLLDEDPRNWMAIKAVEDTATKRGFILPPALADRRAQLYAQDTGIIETSKRCAACAWDATTCDFSAILLCRIPVDLTPLGDLSGVTREGLNYARGREIDEIDLGLSAVGLAAVSLIPITAGGSSMVKAGAGMAKTAWRMGRLSDGLVQPLKRAIVNGFDWPRVTEARSIQELAALARPSVLRPAVAFAADVGRMKKILGHRGTLYLLSRAETMTEARRFANATEAVGPRSIGALEMLGKSRFLRATRRWSNELWWSIAAGLGLVAAMAALFWNLVISLGLRLLRRMAR